MLSREELRALRTSGHCAFMAEAPTEETLSKRVNHDSDEFTNNELESGLIALHMGLMAMGTRDEVIVIDHLPIQIIKALEDKEDHDSQFLCEECASKLSNDLLNIISNC